MSDMDLNYGTELLLLLGHETMSQGLVRNGDKKHPCTEGCGPAWLEPQEDVGGSTPPAGSTTSSVAAHHRRIPEVCHGDAAVRRSGSSSPEVCAWLASWLSSGMHGGDVDAWMAARLMSLKSKGRMGQRMACMA